jgi:Spy/CpxP family protein refolding chaperone
MFTKSVLIAGAALAAAASVLGAAPPATAAPAGYAAQQPWDPGCWGPFSWDMRGCDWSPMSDWNDQWPSPQSGPGQFNRATVPSR